MSAKIEISTVAEAMKSEAIDPAVVRAVIEKLNLALGDDSDDEKAPAIKKQFCVLVSDPEGVMPTTDLVAWIAQIPESESPATLTDRINRAAYDFNATKKGRLLPVKTVGEAVENVPSRFFKEADVWIKTKTPVLVLKTDNRIPRDVGT
jgi:hypothetical protein